MHLAKKGTHTNKTGKGLFLLGNLDRYTTQWTCTLTDIYIVFNFVVNIYRQKKYRYTHLEYRRRKNIEKKRGHLISPADSFSIDQPTDSHMFYYRSRSFSFTMKSPLRSMR